MAINRTQMNALLNRLEKPVQKAFLEAFNKARTFAKIKALVDAVQTGNVDQIMSAIGIRESLYSGLTETVRNAYVQGGTAAIIADLPKRLAMEFNINNPRAETWLRNRSSQLITGDLIPQQRAAIQVMLQEGMIKGKNPRSVALDIVGRISETGRRSGGVIGLTEQQAMYVSNMADDLYSWNAASERLNPVNPRYFNRKLRDRRFDKIVRESMESGTPLPKATREKIVARYSDRMLKHRGDTIGRTEALRALNESSDEALRQIVDEGLAPKESAVRIWRHSYSKDEREGHLMMDGQEAKLDEYFTNPLTGAMLRYPGDGPASEAVNCRCWIEHSIDFAAVELAA